MRAAVLLLLSVVACTTDHDAPERDAFSARAIAGRAFALHGAPLARTSDGYGPQAGALATILPSNAAAPVRLAAGSFSVAVTPLGLRERPAELVDAALVYRDVAEDTDLVWVADGAHAEELRVLRSSRAKASARYRVDGAFRVEDGRIALGDGATRIASEEPTAVDAHGVRRALGVRAIDRETFEVSLDTTGLAYPIVVDPSWSTVSSMSTARADHTATTLTGDVVLVVGGADAAGAILSSAELFDPTTKTWSPTAAMSAKRLGHTATALATGKVLVVGGSSDGSTALSTAQLYDVATKTWSAAASMSEVRTHHTATLLSGNKVLVAGGSDFSPGGESQTAEIYDPSTNAWSAAGTLSIGRQDHTATLLSADRVLVAGGRRGGGNHHSSADLFDPTTKTWSSAGNMITPRSAHAAAALSGDRVLVTGGRAFDSFGSLQTWDKAEVFDLAAKTWTATAAPMAVRRVNHTTTALPEDRVLVVGGDALGAMGTVELFELAKNRFMTFAPLASARADHATAQLSDQNILVTGGRATATLSSVELLSLGALGSSCADGLAECASGLCVDGRCCNAACTGQCEACDLEASKGTCTPVVGGPHGARTACEGSGCAAKHCDGVERSSCAAFADTATVCAAASCTDGSATPDARCDGKGACAPAASVSCAPFACGAPGCKTSCAADADCSGSNVCDVSRGKCVVADSTCTADGLSSQPVDRSSEAKSCAPYRCDVQTGHCFVTCTASESCAPGAVCDAPTGTCVSTATNEDAGGCAMGHGADTHSAWIFAGLLAMVLGRRRLSLLAFGALVGCSKQEAPRTSARETLTKLARFDELREHLGAGGSLVRSSDGLRLAKDWIASDDLDVVLAEGHTHLGTDDPDAWIDVTVPSDRKAAADIEHGAILERDVAPSTDVVRVVERARYEEIRLLRDDRAPTTTRYRIARGPAIVALRLVEGRVEALSESGSVRIRSAPAFAIDDRGTRRALTASLVDDVLELSLDTHGLVYPIAVDPLWTPTPDLAFGRYLHGAAPLPDGRAWVGGGRRSTGSGTVVGTTFAYDPTAKTWSPLANMPSPTDSFVTTVLSGGKLLVTGGNASGLPSRNANVYDGVTNTWESGGSTSGMPYQADVVAALSGDRALAVSQPTALLWTLASKTFVSAGTTTVTHSGHTATTISGDRVLVVGGSAVADLWDPSTSAFAAGGTLAAARSEHTATLLPSGKVLFAGGTGLSTAEIYDPATKTFSSAGAMSTVRTLHTATVLSGDRVLVAGGTDGSSELSTVEIYDGATNSWKLAAPMSVARAQHTATPLSGSRVLVVGGIRAGTPLSTAEIFAAYDKAAACASSTECTSGFCVDGVCCDAACDGQCEACDLAGSEGTCKPTIGVPHGARTACLAGGSGVCARACDGLDRKECHFGATSVVCTPATCAAGSATAASTCDGAGNCPTASTTDCAPYACGDSACKTTCASSADCGGANVCDTKSGKCVVAVEFKCSEDGASAIPTDASKTAVACAPYRCDSSTGRCATRCVTSSDCADGTACETATGLCSSIESPSTGGSDDGGCSTSRTPRSPFALLLLVGVAIARSIRARSRTRWSGRK